MIRYALGCDAGHVFESWFQSSAAYDRQVARGLVTCPACGSAKVEKSIMAPALAKTRRRAAPAAGEDTKASLAVMSPQETEFRRKVKELRDHVIANADNVGDKFPEEARRMHYREAERRSIYGEASAEEAVSLAEEGIEFHPLPRLPDERN